MTILRKATILLIITAAAAVLLLTGLLSISYAETAEGYIVTFSEEVTEQEAEAITDSDDVTMLTDDSALVTDADPEELEQDPDVDSVQNNFVYNNGEDEEEETPSADTMQNCMGKQWVFDYLDVPEAWNLLDKIASTASRQPVKVAVLDTGAYYQHPDLKANMDIEHCVMIKDGEAVPYGRSALVSGHGTSISSIIGSTNNRFGVSGIAAGNQNNLVKIMAIDVFQGKYQGQYSATTADCVAGIRYAVENGAKVIQMCLGHNAFYLDYSGKKHNDKALQAAIDEAAAAGCIVVCSAGNHQTTDAWYPSDLNNTISVINLMKYKNSWAKSCKKRSSNYGRRKDVSSPGYNSYAANRAGGYSCVGGTSAASAQCAAVVALMCYANPGLTSNQALNILASSCDDLYTPGKDAYTGWGKINAYNAVAAAARKAGFSGFSSRMVPRKLASPKLKAKAKKMRIRLKWSKVPGANYYKVYRKVGSHGSYRCIKKTTSLHFVTKVVSRKKPVIYKVKALGTTKDGKQTKSGFSNKVKIKHKKRKS